MISYLTIYLFALTTASPSLPYTVETIKGKPHRIYWTIDDHPCKGTSPMLKILKKEKIRATFFVNGWSLIYYYKHPEYPANKRNYARMMKICKSPHVMGNHSVTHRFMCKLPKLTAYWEVNENQRLIKKACGRTMKWWRPPHGIWLGKACRHLRAAVYSLGLKILFWHVDDYRKSAYYMYRRTVWRATHGKPYTIVLFHCQPYKLRTYLKLIRKGK